MADVFVKTTLKKKDKYLYPTTYYDQIILPNGERWDGKAVSGGEGVYIGADEPEDNINFWVDTDEPDAIIGYEIYTGDTEPTAPSYDLWIDTSEEPVEVLPKEKTMKKDAIKYKAFSIESSDWVGEGPYTYSMEAIGITDSTAIINLTLDATSQVNQKAQLDWETAENLITLSTSILPEGTIAGYLIAAEVTVI